MGAEVPAGQAGLEVRYGVVLQRRDGYRPGAHRWRRGVLCAFLQGGGRVSAPAAGARDRSSRPDRRELRPQPARVGGLAEGRAHGVAQVTFPPTAEKGGKQ